MDDVKDLQNVKIQPQTISLSAFKRESNNENTSQNVVIDMVKHTDSQQQPINTARVSSVPYRRPLQEHVLNNRTNKTIVTESDLNKELNPNGASPSPRDNKNFKDTIRDNAFSDLDAMIKRKQQELQDFYEKAMIDDKINRERIQDGIEDVGGELVYRIEDLPADVTKDPNSVYEQNKDTEELSKTGIDDLEEELNNIDDQASFEAESNYNKNIKISNPFETTTNDDNNSPSEINSVDSDIDQNTTDQVSEEEYENIPDKTEDLVDNTKTEKEKTVEKTTTDTNSVKSLLNNTIEVRSAVDIGEDVKKLNSKPKSMDIDEEDFDDLDNEEDVNTQDEISQEERDELSKKSLEHLKSEILKKVINTSNKLNLQTMKMSSKVADVRDALRITKSIAPKVTTGSWPMMYAKRNFVATALRGPDVAILVEAERSDNNRFGITVDQAKIMYEHDANPYKPSTVVGWSKTIPYDDLDAIYAALYLASLKGAYYMPRVCTDPKCQYSYLKTAPSLESMIKFPNDKVKEKFNKIKNINPTKENSQSYESTITVINDRFAVGLKVPSIFTVLYENSGLDDTFIDKYSNMITLMRYIDYLYIVDQEDNNIRRIEWKTYPGDYTKSFKSKIATYSKIFKEFDEADFSIVLALIRSMTSGDIALDNTYSYNIPEEKCPKCGHIIESDPTSAKEMVFTRQRLVELATLPTEK